MSKNPEDEKLVTKRAVKESLNRFSDKTGLVFEEELFVAIDKLPAVLPNSWQAGEIKLPEEIERAIKGFEKDSKNVQNKEQKFHNEICIICLKWVLNQGDEEQIFGKPKSGKVGE